MRLPLLNPNIQNNLRHYLVAGSAVLVSVCSLFLSIYQSKLMAEQQRVSVWPYLEWYTTNTEGYRLTAHNKGVGPAIVRKVEMTVGGKPVDGNRGMVEAVLGPDHELQWINSSLEGRVLSAGESVAFFDIADRAAGRDFEQKLRARKLTLRITYCSVYGDCWYNSRERVERAPSEALNLY